MNKVLKTILIVVAILVLAGGAFYTGSVVSKDRSQASITPLWGGPQGVVGRGFGHGPGMMGHGYGTGPGMIGRWPSSGPGAIEPLSIEKAREAVQTYLEGLNLSDLKIHEIMIFNNHAYAEIVEESTGIGAFEVLVQPITLAVYPEHGPNMMWNLKYGGLNHANMMSGRGRGMMGGYYQWIGTPPDVLSAMTITPEQAIEAAQKYLDTYLPDTTAAVEADPFYGYYTIHVLRDGEVIGMLSVNGFSGQVFYHFWHGNFVEMSEE